MTKPIPPLSPLTACKFTVPRSISRERLKHLDKYLKGQIPTRYRGLKGRTLFFDFPDSTQRDAFLVELEQMLMKRGSASERID